MGKKWTVYIHRNIINGKVYVGITYNSAARRWGRNGAGYKTQNFFKAISKYGWANFSHEIISTGISENEAKALETNLILKYRAYERNFGYNLTTGGEQNRPNAEVKAKQSQTMKGMLVGEKNGMYGKKHTRESRERMSALLKGKYTGVNSYWYGKSLPSDVCKKISENHADFTGDKHPKAKE